MTIVLVLQRVSQFLRHVAGTCHAATDRRTPLFQQDPKKWTNESNMEENAYLHEGSIATAPDELRSRISPDNFMRQNPDSEGSPLCTHTADAFHRRRWRGGGSRSFRLLKSPEGTHCRLCRTHHCRSGRRAYSWPFERSGNPVGQCTVSSYALRASNTTANHHLRAPFFLWDFYQQTNRLAGVGDAKDSHSNIYIDISIFRVYLCVFNETIHEMMATQPPLPWRPSEGVTRRRLSATSSNRKCCTTTGFVRCPVCDEQNSPHKK